MAITGGLETAVALVSNQPLAANEPVSRGDIANSTMEANVAVVVNEGSNNPTGLIERPWRLGSDRCGLEGLVPSLDLPIRLRVVGCGAHVCHAGDADVFGPA